MRDCKVLNALAGQDLPDGAFLVAVTGPACHWLTCCAVPKQLRACAWGCIASLQEHIAKTGADHLVAWLHPGAFIASLVVTGFAPFLPSPRVRTSASTGSPSSRSTAPCHPHRHHLLALNEQKS